MELYLDSDYITRLDIKPGSTYLDIISMLSLYYPGYEFKIYIEGERFLRGYVPSYKYGVILMKQTTKRPDYYESRL